MPNGIGTALRDLADVVDAIEGAGGAVSRVRTEAGDTVALRLEVQLPFVDEEVIDRVDVTVESSTITADGELTLDVAASTGVDGAATPAEQSATADTGSGDDEDVLSAATGSAPERSRHETADDAPAYRDPARLQAVYDDYDTFPEMTEALGVDVTPQTVRRHMIDLGIHEPDGSAATGESAGGDGTSTTGGQDADRPDDEGESTTGVDDAESTGDQGPTLDGIDGDDVSVDELKDAVQSSRTIHEVSQQLGLPREQTFRLLNALDLVDLVSGRLESADRPISAEELDQRIERAAAAGR